MLSKLFQNQHNLVVWQDPGQDMLTHVINMNVKVNIIHVLKYKKVKCEEKNKSVSICSVLMTPRLEAEILSNFSFHMIGSFQFTKA